MFVINCLSSKSSPVISSLRYLAFLCLHYNIWVKARHIPIKNNIIADTLSRRQMKRFFPPDAQPGYDTNPLSLTSIGLILSYKNFQHSIAPTWHNYTSAWLLWLSMLISHNLTLSQHYQHMVFFFS